jgi:glycosyltransferase involved in cell wall biosynthesis
MGLGRIIKYASRKMKKLRIATMVSAHFTVPPPEGIVYAPMDIAVDVADGLTKRGHSVDFYAPRGSKLSSARIADVGLEALKQDGAILKGPNVGAAEQAKIFNLWDQYLIAKMFEAAESGAYDLLYIHPVDRALPLALSHPDLPVVYTLHDPIYPWRAEVFRMFQSPNQYYISISDAQRLPAPDLQYAATIYNGIRLDSFPFSSTHDNYLLFVGRLHPEKGVAEAVDVARRSGENLVIIGPPVTGEYWENLVAPYLGEKIKYIGYVPREELAKYYSRAKAVLVPIRWEEPFGLVMIESMACGTPVIAFRRGSVPEVVVQGKTGFIVETIDEMAQATGEVEKINRAACRKHVEEKFSVEKMVGDYEKVFLKIAGS